MILRFLGLGFGIVARSVFPDLFGVADYVKKIAELK
jgi:hypothetical protein